MPLQKKKARLRLPAHVPAALLDCRNIAWDGHDLVVISRFNVLRD
jgi:hypothetical protein